MKKVSKGHHGSLNELNITPLLDLAFVLLVIFIITTPQLSNDLEMNLPSAKKANKPAKPPQIQRIFVDTTGKITLNGQPTELPALKKDLLALKASDPDVSVVVKGPPRWTTKASFACWIFFSRPTLSKSAWRPKPRSNSRSGGPLPAKLGRSSLRAAPSRQFSQAPVWPHACDDKP